MNKQRVRRLAFLITTLVAHTGQAAYAQQSADLVEVEPYLLAPTVVTAELASPLDTVIKVTFPAEVRTVGQAIKYVLAGSGWRLANGSSTDPAQATLLALPLPEVQRQLPACALWHALTVLADPKAYMLERDYPNRLISFTLREKYQSWRTGTRSVPISAPRRSLPVVRASWWSGR